MKSLECNIRQDLDADLVLRDFSLDPEVSPERRAICALTLGVGVNHAFYFVQELRQAISWTHDGKLEGKRKLSEILSSSACDYQRSIYYSLAGRGIVNTLNDLDWLFHQLAHRGRLCAENRQKGFRFTTDPNPYVAPEADGPLPEFDPHFELGPSWGSEALRPRPRLYR